MNNEFQISNSTGMFSSPTVARGAVVTFRTSNGTYQSVGAGAASSPGGGRTNISNKQNISSENVVTSAYSVKRTTSFTAIHKDVADVATLVESGTAESIVCAPRRSRRGENPGGPAVGDASVPAGDMLLPLLVMAAAYIVVKLFRNHKTSHTL